MKTFFYVLLIMFIMIYSSAYSQIERRLPADTTLTLGLKVTLKDSCSAIGATVKYDTSMFRVIEIVPQNNFDVEACNIFPEGRLEIGFSQFNCHNAKYKQTLLLAIIKVYIKFPGQMAFPRTGRFQVLDKYAKMCDKNLRGRSIDWSVIVDDLSSFLIEFQIIK